MPGRIGNSPGPQVLTPERPVPAARRSSLLTSKPQTVQHQRQSSCDTNDNYSRLHKGQQSMAPNGIDGQTFTEIRRPSAVGHSVQSQLSYSQPQKPVSTVRPQSTSSPKSYHHTVTSERMAPSPRLDWTTHTRNDRGPVYSMNEGRKTPVISPPMNTSHLSKSPQYGEQDGVSHLHDRHRSFGDGSVNVTPANSNSELTEKMYGTVFKQQDHAGFNTYDRRTHVRDLHSNGNYQDITKGQLSNCYSNSPESHRGEDNPAFVPDDKIAASKSPVSSTMFQGHDLRNAWQKFYGGRTDLPPQIQKDEGITRKPATCTCDENVRPHNASTVNSQHASPQSTRPVHVTSSPNTQPTIRGNTSPSSALRPSSGSAINRQHIHLLDTSSNPNEYPNSNPVNPNSFVGDRDSPTGQSFSNIEQTPATNNASQANSFPVSGRNLSTFKPENNKLAKQSETAIGPAARYPEMPMHSASRKSPRLPAALTPVTKNFSQGFSSSTQAAGIAAMRHRSLSSQSGDTIEFKVEDNAMRPLFRARKKSPVFLDSEDDLNDEEFVMATSDYAGSEKERDMRPMASSQGSGRSTPANIPSRLVNGSPALSETRKTPDLVRHSNKPVLAGSFPARLENILHNQSMNHNGIEHDQGSPHMGKHLLTEYTRSRSLEDVRESGNESVISFDIENTVLTVEASDQSEMGTLRSYKTGSSVKAQLNRLEDMYSRVMRTIDENKSHGPRAKRRWSIGSSDTSSLRQQTHHGRHNRSSNQKLGSKDVKAINRRFQRLESHVITLARSVAHLSSELRNQTTMTREIENVKREITELKLERQAAHPNNTSMGGHRGTHDHEKYRYWSPFFANPRRVGKLTRFFGQEPPLLELFLKKLGYEKYLKNFENEQITMIELPYMTDERLDRIGIPMGPRIRILQEAQLCVKKGDFDIYFV